LNEPTVVERGYDMSQSSPFDIERFQQYVQVFFAIFV
jgi:hypothetical protein